MDADLISFLRKALDADVHDVVRLTSLAPPDVDVHLDSTVPMLDGVDGVVDLYAEAAHAVSASGPDGADAFALGRAAGLGDAMRLLAEIYHEAPGYRDEWRPVTRRPWRAH